MIPGILAIGPDDGQSLPVLALEWHRAPNGEMHAASELHPENSEDWALLIKTAYQLLGETLKRLSAGDYETLVD